MRRITGGEAGYEPIAGREYPAATREESNVATRSETVAPKPGETVDMDSVPMPEAVTESKPLPVPMPEEVPRRAVLPAADPIAIIPEAPVVVPAPAIRFVADEPAHAEPVVVPKRPGRKRVAAEAPRPRRATAKRAPAKKKPTATKATAKKATAKKATAKKAPARKSAAKKAPAKRATAKKTGARKTAKR